MKRPFGSPGEEPYLLRSFKVITIRHSVKAFLETNHGIESKFIPHPFFPYEKLGEGLGYEFVSISRIDFDKNIHIILQANHVLTLRGPPIVPLILFQFISPSTCIDGTLVGVH
eukprot:COSAG01_NODE_4776_length_4750_cov_21.200817_1_plen_112_part_10